MYCASAYCVPTANSASIAATFLTAAACASFALLVLMKLYGSFQRAKRDNKEQRARSAFMTEDCSFNVLDPDYVAAHPAVEMTGGN